MQVTGVDFETNKLTVVAATHAGGVVGKTLTTPERRVNNLVRVKEFDREANALTVWCVPHSLDEQAHGDDRDQYQRRSRWCAFNPQPEIRIPKSSTLGPRPSTLNPKPRTLNPTP